MKAFDSKKILIFFCCLNRLDLQISQQNNHSIHYENTVITYSKKLSSEEYIQEFQYYICEILNKATSSTEKKKNVSRDVSNLISIK